MSGPGQNARARRLSTSPNCPAARACSSLAAISGTADADYAVVVPFVDTAAPAGSRLLTKMTGNGHQGGAVYAAGFVPFAHHTDFSTELNLVYTFL